MKMGGQDLKGHLHYHGLLHKIQNTLSEILIHSQFKCSKALLVQRILAHFWFFFVSTKENLMYLVQKGKSSFLSIISLS